jgi:hypothetical protein
VPNRLAPLLEGLANDSASSEERADSERWKCLNPPRELISCNDIDLRFDVSDALSCSSIEERLASWFNLGCRE